jgi:acetyltransferase-like isoleucine patch superfamily enzyme
MLNNSQKRKNFLHNGTSTMTDEVVVEKPVYIEKSCPAPEIHIDTLHIKSDDDIKVKNGKIVVQKQKKDITVSRDWVIGDDCEIHTPQEVVQGKYAITSLFNIEPSHLPPNFMPNPKYPKDCNERNYYTNKEEQGKVIKNANRFNARFLINDDNTPENGAIIVDKNGLILGGNGRAMTLLMAISEIPAKYKNYYDTLLKRCSCFGIDAKSIENIEHPVLVRVINTNSEKHCQYYSRIFNDSLKLKMDNMDMSISYIKSLEEKRY